MEDALGDLENAELHARQALAVDPSPVNQSGLARILSEVHDSVKNQEALTLAKSATQTEPQDIYKWYALLLAAVKLQDVDSMNLASNQMVDLAPTNSTGYYFRGFVAAYNGEWEQSEADLRLAEQYGIPKEEIDRVLIEGGIHTQVMIRRGLYGTGIGPGVWLAGLGLLFLVGLLLSKRTLKAVDREMLSGTFEISSQEQFLRRLYRSVIAVTSVYFCLYIPILILLVVLLLYLFLMIGQVPVNLALFILLAGLYTLFAILRSLFARFKETDPGRPGSPEEMPELWQLVREVA